MQGMQLQIYVGQKNTALLRLPLLNLALLKALPVVISGAVVFRLLAVYVPQQSGRLWQM